MRCATARARMAEIADTPHLAGDPELSDHLEGCPECAAAWRLHAAILRDLAAPPALPPFPDLAPRVLGALDAHPSRRSPAWQWAAAAALALVALFLGFLIGRASAGPAPSPDTMAATYLQALTASSSPAAEVAYLESGGRSAAARSAP